MDRERRKLFSLHGGVWDKRGTRRSADLRNMLESTASAGAAVGPVVWTGQLGPSS